METPESTEGGTVRGVDLCSQENNCLHVMATVDEVSQVQYNCICPRDVAQLGRALRSGRRGRRFESCHPDHMFCQKKLIFINQLLLLLC